MSSLYGFLADVVLVVHFSFVAFVVLGLVFIWVGYSLRSRLVRNFGFRTAHLLAMGVVVAESIFGVVCPLTTWERELRWLAGGGQTYRGSFVQHWVHQILFFDLPQSTFLVLYVIFFLAIVLSLVVVPPNRPRWSKRRSNGSGRSSEDPVEPPVS